MKFLKRLLFTLPTILGLVLLPNVAVAQLGGGVGSAEYWTLNGTTLSTVDSSWSLGSSSNRINSIYTSNLDASTLLISSLSANGCLVAGGTATSTLCGTGNSHVGGTLTTSSTIEYTTGVAFTGSGSKYIVGRNSDATNLLQLNVPTGSSFEFSVNDTTEMTLSATAVNFQNNSITTTGGGSLTGTWSDLGSVTTVDINGGTVDGVVIGGSSAAAATFTTVSQSNLTTWSSGNAFTAGSYQIGRDASATNLLGFNVPTGSGFLWTVQGTTEFGVNASGAFLPTGNNLKLYNTSDITTNTESVTMDWNSNVARIYTFPTGTGTARNLQISAFNASSGGGTITLSSSAPFIQITNSSTGTSGSLAGYSGTSTGSSGTTNFFYVIPTVNQSSTAAFNAFLINPTLTSLGSGTKNLALFQAGGTDVYAFGLAGNYTQTQVANTSSSAAPVAYTLTGGAHTNGTAATEWNDIKINLSATKTWNTGAIVNQRDIVYNPRTYAAVGASTFSNGVSISYNGGPLSGTNVTLSHSAIAEYRTWSSNATVGVNQISMYMPGIANGVGSTQSVAGLVIDAEGSNPVSLGNQTATTDAVVGIAAIPVTYQSTTNVRTVTAMASILAYAPVAGTNVTVTNGPYAFWGIGNSRFDSLVTQAGSSTATSTVGGTLNVNVTGVGNVGAGEDDLMSYAVPAAALATNKDYVEFQAAGTFANSVNNKQLKAYFGSTLIFDSGTLAITTATDWTLRCTVIRTGATTQHANCFLNTSNATLSSYAKVSTPAETLSGAVTFKTTGTGTADNDVRTESIITRYFPGK